MLSCPWSVIDLARGISYDQAMKLAYRDIEPFVKSPDKAARVILVYGSDAGLVSERANTMGKTVCPDLNDPFNVCTMTADQLIDDPARLSDEANAISMMGGDRLIRIEDGADKLTTLLKTYLENPSPSALVVVRAGELGTKSTLRALCEKAKNAAAVPCYVEDARDLTRFIQDTVRAENKNIDRDAVAWLASNISGDRRKVRTELDKLLIYKWNEAGSITLADAQAACGAAGVQSFDDLVYAVAGRNAASALRAYTTLTAEGENFVTILRVMQNHFRKLHLVKSYVAAGEDTDIAMKRLNPPIFFKQADMFRTQVNQWTMPALNTAMQKLTDLEAQCKQTGMPTETLCAQAILSISKSRAGYRSDNHL